jgi:chemotaxis protein MotB
MEVINPAIGKSEKNKILPLVIIKITMTNEPYSSGAWKIAYADFVTAMMAFFLLMWLVENSSEAQLLGVAEYFKTPLMVALAGGKSKTDLNSVVNVGSNSPIENNAQLKKGEEPEIHRLKLTEVQREVQRKEMVQLQELKHHLEQEVDAHAELREFKDQFQIDITTEGLRVQIIDKQNRPMFDRGSANLKSYTVDILHRFGNSLNGVSNKIGITGHTDAAPYQGAARNYSNWELSLDRANAARRALVDGGMKEDKISRVVGLSSSVLLVPTDPLNAKNRRISIIVMNAQAEKTASMDGAPLESE